MNLHKSFRSRLPHYLKWALEPRGTWIHISCIRILSNISGLCCMKKQRAWNTDCQNSAKYLMGILAQEVLTEDTARLSGHLAVPENIQRRHDIKRFMLRAGGGGGNRKKEIFTEIKPQQAQKIVFTSCLMELINKQCPTDKMLRKLK